MTAVAIDVYKRQQQGRSNLNFTRGTCHPKSRTLSRISDIFCVKIALRQSVGDDFRAVALADLNQALPILVVDEMELRRMFELQVPEMRSEPAYAGAA